jgi:acetoin utilization protein AcuC
VKTAFFYSERFGSAVYGETHPMRPVRLTLAYELMRSLGLLSLPGATVVEARKATPGELLSFHTEGYVAALKGANGGVMPVDGPAHGLGPGDNPAFRGVYDWSRYSAGASIQAAEIVSGGDADVAFNIAGGLHHAMPDRASGFCYINDAVLAVKRLTALGRRVAYVDVDAHHGDGVEFAFRDVDDVLTVSLHEGGQWLFPGTGFSNETGIGRGRGFSVNLPFPPGAGDELFVKGFMEVVPAFMEAFRPDVLVTQLGVDTFASDPITHLSLTTNGFEEMVRAFASFDLPWVALGGGGYDLSNVARGWTLAWAAMNRVSAPDFVPADILALNREIFRGEALRDAPLSRSGPIAEDERKVEEEIRYLKREVLPLVARAR